MLSQEQLTAGLADALERAPGLSHLGPAQSGKVRDAWPLGGGKRLLVTSERVSAFDRVLGTIPYKGQVLNQLSAWWFEKTKALVKNHLLAVVDPNAMVVRDAEPLPVEVVVRGFITGVTSTSLWTLYKDGVERPYGLELPEGLHKDDRLPRPVITPTTKAGPGQHDARLSPHEIEDRLVDRVLWKRVTDAAIALFEEGQRVAEAAGLLLVDTKYEFGLVNGELCLIDEIHTPDSSRYWLKSAWEARLQTGQPPEHLDKELLRLELKAMGYSGDGPAPALPDALRTRLGGKYIELFERLTGTTFEPGAPPHARLWSRVTTPIVPILMGSKSDLEHARHVQKALESFGVQSDLRIASAHKSPARLLDVIEQYETDPRPKVYVAIAGRSNALSAMLCAAVTAPVVSCPPYSDRFGGADVFSSLRMPSGVAPALVLDPDNAAFFCAKVLGLQDAGMRQRVAAVQAQHRERLRRDDEELARG